jgi:hypothetical protein
MLKKGTLRGRRDSHRDVRRTAKGKSQKREGTLRVMSSLAVEPQRVSDRVSTSPGLQSVP